MARLNWRRRSKSFLNSKPKTLPRRKPQARLFLELLEDRETPATFTWSGAGADANWSNSANWTEAGAPGMGTEIDDLVFPNDSSVTQRSTNNDLAGGVFNTITLAGNNYTLAGNQITLGDPALAGSGRIIVNSGAIGETISLNVQLGGAAGKQFLTVNTGGVLTISSQLSGSGSIELTKEGSGTLILSGDNLNFQGPITVQPNSGIVRISHANALGDTTFGTTVGLNSQLEIDTTTPINFSETLVLSGVGSTSAGALRNLSGNNTWSGNIVMEQNTTFSVVADSLTVSGVISDLGAGANITKIGAGRMALSSANTYRGVTTIENGVLEIRNANALGTADGTAATATIVNSISSPAVP